jgi:voltage-gated potassium channel
MSLREAVREHGVRVVLRLPLRGHTPVAKNFRYVLLGLDVLSIAWIVTASFYGPIPAVLAVDALLGVLLLAEFAMRVAASGRPWHAATRPLNIADLLAILSLLLAPLLHGALGFLRVLRTLRLLHSVRLISSLRRTCPSSAATRKRRWPPPSSASSCSS